MTVHISNPITGFT